MRTALNLTCVSPISYSYIHLNILSCHVFFHYIRNNVLTMVDLVLQRTIRKNVNTSFQQPEIKAVLAIFCNSI